MNESSIKRYTTDELRKRTRSGESRTDTVRCDALSDNELEQAIASDPDWAGIPDNWYERAEAVMPRPKVPVSIRLDADLIDHFRSTGPGWQTRINAILRAYRDASRAASKSRAG